jgi:uncharacterized protein YutE (UPF0331/DUF86 family)
MTPRELNPAVLLRRLEDMRGLVDYLRGRASVTAEELAGNTEIRLAVERALTQLVELATSINSHVVAAAGAVPPSDYFSSFIAAGEAGLIDPDLARRLAPSAGLRNVLVHEYARIDLAHVARSVPLAVDDFGEYLRQAARHLQR